MRYKMQTAYGTTEYIVTFRMYYWMFEFSENIAKFQKWVGLAKPKYLMSKSGSSSSMHDFSILCKCTYLPIKRLKNQSNPPVTNCSLFYIWWLLVLILFELSTYFDTADVFLLMIILSSFVLGASQFPGFHS